MSGETDIADALDRIAVHLKYLGVGDAATTMGAIEFHAVAAREAAETHAESRRAIAAAIRSVSESIQEVADNLGRLEMTMRGK